MLVKNEYRAYVWYSPQNDVILNLMDESVVSASEPIQSFLEVFHGFIIFTI
jgi:hypothetical protein